MKNKHSDGPEVEVKQPNINISEPIDKPSLRAIPTDSVLTLENYASFLDLSEEAVWLMVRSGTLYSRYKGDELYVSQSPIPVEASTEKTHSFSQSPVIENTQRLVRELVIKDKPKGSDEMALLIDHLSLAKEENREILELTRQSMAQMNEMTKKIVDMKDKLLDSQDGKISLLEEKLENESKQIKALRQTVEDLEILAATLSEQR